MNFRAIALLFLGLSTRLGAEPTLLYIGQAATVITSSSGTRVASDPYREASQAVYLENYPTNIQADAVTISHAHADHDNRSAVGGKALLINKPGDFQVGDISLHVFEGRHGAPVGRPTGANRICVFEVGGVKIVHLADSAVVSDPAVLKAIEHADVVLVAVGTYVIPIPEIMGFMTSIKARTIIPVHMETLDQIDTFLKTVPQGLKVTRSGPQLAMAPGMPHQVVIMAPSALVRQ